jgi:hypothetical protein
VTTDILSTYLAAGNDPEMRSALEQFGLRLLFKHVDVNLTAYLTPEGAQMNPDDSSPLLTIECSSIDAAALYDGRLTLAGALHRGRLVIRGPVKHALNLVDVFPHLTRHLSHVAA